MKIQQIYWLNVLFFFQKKKEKKNSEYLPECQPCFDVLLVEIKANDSHSLLNSTIACEVKKSVLLRLCDFIYHEPYPRR